MFDAVKVKNNIVEWIRRWFDENGNLCNAVIGISGGKDSSIVAALCAEALGKDRVIGVLMPDGVQNDIEDSRQVVEYLGINSIEVNIGMATQGIIGGINGGILLNMKRCKGPTFYLSEQSLVNLPARVRMATLYAVSQSNNGRVANTCNLSEDWVGYATRYGDSAGDFSPLAMLTTDEVVAIGRACGIPDNLVDKIPSDGLCGKTDEDNLGFTYKVLNKYIRTGVCESEDIKGKIDNMHKKNMFKLMPMPVFEYTEK